ncbi:hypothetical protein GYMLUDRAFT_236327 [Collybiopsis luxurians FD-317 M1]|nr:hypothetical protein GYMLUDRAFT_236327 [Collybiopsis luxurians FD-317 M1]
MSKTNTLEASQLLKPPQRSSVTVEEVEDKDNVIRWLLDQQAPSLDPDNPILMGVNKWLSLDEMVKNPKEYSEKALQVWLTTSEKYSSNLSPYQQKHHWIYKFKSNIKGGKALLPVQQTSNLDAKGKPISIIGAPAMECLLTEGTPAYFLHVCNMEEILENIQAEQLQAANMTPKELSKTSNSVLEALKQPKDPTSDDKDHKWELNKLLEEEELKKYIPEQYRDFLDVFSPGEAKELPPH